MTRPRTEQRTATLGGRAVRYTVTTSPAARKARIRVGPAGVEVVVPKSSPPDRAAAFLAEQAEWVLAQLDRVERLGGIRTAAAGPRPGTILLHGERVPVRLVPEESRRAYALVCRSPDGLVVRVPRSGAADPAAAVEQWLRRDARERAEARVGVWAKVLRRAPNRVYVRGQRTKWGNCSKLGNLSFNWRLAMAPDRVLDAIVVHELAHLIEPTHRPRFWLLVRSHLPDYHERVRWLSEHSHLLTQPLPFAEAGRAPPTRPPRPPSPRATSPARRTPG